MRRLLPDAGRRRASPSRSAGSTSSPSAPADRPVRDHQLRAHARRPRDDRRALGHDRHRRRHGDAGRPAHPVDAVMIGAGTMRAERYGRVVGDPAKRERRERDGLPPDPLMVIVSRPPRPPVGRAAVHRGARPGRDLHRLRDEPPETATPVEVVRHQDAVDLAAALAHPAPSAGVRALLCEGGPRLHAQLIEAGLVDELFVTHAPKLAGGDGPGPRRRACRRRSARSSSPGSSTRTRRASSSPATGASRARPSVRSPRRGSGPPASTPRSPRRSIRRPRIVAPRIADGAQAQLDAEHPLAASSRRRGGRAAAPPRRR